MIPESFDPAHMDIDSDEAIVLLLDAQDELDAESDPYPVTEAELAEAQRRVQLLLDQANAAVRDDTIGIGDTDDVIAQITIIEIEEWLAQAPADAVRARGPISLSTVDRTVPELATAGYAPDVEIDVDVDSENGRLDLSVQLASVDPVPSGLVVTVVDPAGGRRSARVNRYGLATVSGIPADGVGSLVIIWSRDPGAVP